MKPVASIPILAMGLVMGPAVWSPAVACIPPAGGCSYCVCRVSGSFSMISCTSPNFFASAVVNMVLSCSAFATSSFDFPVSSAMISMFRFRSSLKIASVSLCTLIVAVGLKNVNVELASQI